MRTSGKSIDTRATMCLVGATLCWSSVPLFLKYLTVFIPDGWTTNGYRYPLAAVLYLPWLIGGVRSGKVTRAIWLAALVPSAVNLTAQCLWAWAPYFIDPGLMAFAVRLSVVWATLTAFLIFHDERALLTSKRFWFGLLLAMTGFVGMALFGGVLEARATAVGVVIMLACSVFWGMYAVSVRWAMKQTDARIAFALVCLYTAAGTVPLMLLFGSPAQIVATPPSALALLVVSAILGIATAHVLFYAAVKSVGVAIGSSAGLAGAVLTASAAVWLFPAQRLNAGEWLSGIVLLGGSLLLIWSQERLRTNAVPTHDTTE